MNMNNLPQPPGIAPEDEDSTYRDILYRRIRSRCYDRARMAVRACGENLMLTPKQIEYVCLEIDKAEEADK